MSTDHTEALPSGYELLEYRLQKVIGEGGFGITYLAHDSTLDCLVAVKEYLPIETARRTASAYTVRPRSSNTEGDFNWGLEQFLEEARRLNRLNHPNIIRVRRFFKENGTAYLVMDYADGPTLETWLQQHGRLSYEDVAGLLRPLLDGLDHVHRNSYLHRDIKPDNIILRNATQLGVRNPVLIDFGAARQAIGARTHKLTTLVSAGYSPLEQYAANRPQTPAGDIYALAGVAYRCLYGIEPQPSPDRSLDDNLPGHLHQLVGQAPEAFLAAIEKGLSIKAVDRYQSVTTFRESLFQGEPEAQAQPDFFISPTPLTAEATEAALEQQGEESGSNRSHRARRKGTVKYSAEQATDEPPSGPISSDHQTKWKVWLAKLASTALESLPRWARLAIGGARGSEAALVQPQESVSRNRAAVQFASLAVMFAYLSSSIFIMRGIFIHGVLPDINDSSDAEMLSHAFLNFPLATVIVAFLSHRFFKPPKAGTPISTFMAILVFSVLSYLFLSVLATSLYLAFQDGMALTNFGKLYEMIVVIPATWGVMFKIAPFAFSLFFILYFTLCINHDKGLGIQPTTWGRLPRKSRMALFIVLALFLVSYFLSIIDGHESSTLKSPSTLKSDEVKRYPESGSASRNKQIATPPLLQNQNDLSTHSIDDTPNFTQAWLKGNIYGADSKYAAAKPVHLTLTDAGYKIEIPNQFNTKCDIEFSSNGNPRRLSNCKCNDGWIVEENSVTLLCAQLKTEVVCSGDYTLKKGSYLERDVIRIARRNSSST